MNANELQQYNSYCRAYYNPENPGLMKEADNRLGMFRKMCNIPKIRYILLHSNVNFGQLFAATSLSLLIDNNWNSLSVQQKKMIRNFLLEVLLNRFASFVNVTIVVSKIVEALSKCCKYGWLDDETNRVLPQQIQKHFVKSNNLLKIRVGLMILKGFVETMNSSNCGHFTLPKNRKISSSFRDICLRDIFECGLRTLIQLSKNRKTNNVSKDEILVYRSCMELCLGCLNYDFISMFPSDTKFMTEVVVVALPDSWRPLLEESDCVAFFWDLYMQMNDMDCKRQLMQILIHLSCVRRAIFSDELERLSYVNKFLEGILRVLESKNGLTNQPIFHDFCRLLARMKNNFMVMDYIKCDNYPKWIEFVARFSILVFKQWKFSPNSAYYILDFWRMFLKYEHTTKFVFGGKIFNKNLQTRILNRKRTPTRKLIMRLQQQHLRNSSLMKKRDLPPTNLKKYAPRVASEYVLSRLEFARGVVQSNGTIDNPLNTPDLEQQMKLVTHLIHSDYSNAQKMLIGLFNNLFNQYKNILAGSGSNEAMKKINEIEGQLAWLIYIFGSVIGFKTSDAQELLIIQEVDATLAVRVFNMFSMITQRIRKIRPITSNANDDKDAVNTIERLELSVLFFLTRFRLHYLQDPNANEKLFAVLSKPIPPCSTPRGVFQIYIQKFTSNLKFWGNSNVIIRKTLQLFEFLCTSIHSGSIISELPSMQYFLQKHGPEEFAFLRSPKNLNLRVKFYQILTRSFFIKYYKEKDFFRYLRPIENVLVKLDKVFSPNNTNINVEQFEQPILGVFRDLRGVCSALRVPLHYQYFFNMMYPRFYGSLICRIIICYCNRSNNFKFISRLFANLLKFVREVVTNTGRRIQFGFNSSNGILLFKETSSILLKVGVYISKLPNFNTNNSNNNNVNNNNNQRRKNQNSEVYSIKYKLILLICSILHRSMCGKYCNFGVFELYNDKSLLNSVGMAVQLSLTIPKRDVLQYQKVSKAYYNLVNALFSKDFIELTVIKFDTNIFLGLLSSIAAGLDSDEMDISTMNCNALDSLCTFLFNQLSSKNSQSKALPLLRKHLSQKSAIFQDILGKLFNTILYQDRGNQWSISRVILSLICIEKDFYPSLQKKITGTIRDQNRRARMTKEWVNLMKDVKLSLDEKNRTKFTENLVGFRANCKSFL